MENSKLENLPINQLVYISQKLMKSNFDYTNPYSDYDDDINKLDKILPYFGLDAQQIDLDFIAKFISINEQLILLIRNPQDIEPLREKFIIPEIGKYEVFYEIWGPATYTEHYKTEWPTYDKEWVRDSIQAARNEGTWSDYDGDYIEHETDNWDPDNFRFNRISTVIEEKINTLEKTTLLELRNLIDKKLKNL